MSHFLDRLTYFNRARSFCRRPRCRPPVRTVRGRRLSQPLGRHDRSFAARHGVNCTGSCSWKIFKGGIVTWETQQTGLPHRWDMPEPRATWLRPRRVICGTCTAPTASSTHGARPLLKAARRRLASTIQWRHGRPSSTMKERDAATRRCAASVASCVRAGTRSTRSSAAPTSTRSLYGPDRVIGFLADSGHVDGELRCRQPLSEPDRRRLRRASTTGTATCRRPARKSGASRPTCRSRPTGQLDLHHRLGSKRSADADTRHTSSPRFATRAPRRWR